MILHSRDTHVTYGQISGPQIKGVAHAFRCISFYSIQARCNALRVAQSILFTNFVRAKKGTQIKLRGHKNLIHHC